MITTAENSNYSSPDQLRGELVKSKIKLCQGGVCMDNCSNLYWDFGLQVERELQMSYEARL